MGNTSSAGSRKLVPALSAVPELVALHQGNEKNVSAAAPIVFNVTVLKGKFLPRGNDGSSCIDLALRTRKWAPQTYRTREGEKEGDKVRFDQGFTFSVHPEALENAVLCVSVLSDSATQCKAQRDLSVKHLLRNGSKLERVLFGAVQYSTKAIPSVKFCVQIVDTEYYWGSSQCASPRALTPSSFSLYSSENSSTAGAADRGESAACTSSSSDSISLRGCQSQIGPGSGKGVVLSHGMGFVMATRMVVEKLGDGRLYVVVEGDGWKEVDISTNSSLDNMLLAAKSDDSLELLSTASSSQPVSLLRRSGDTNTPESSNSSMSTPNLISSPCPSSALSAPYSAEADEEVLELEAARAQVHLEAFRLQQKLEAAMRRESTKQERIPARYGALDAL